DELAILGGSHRGGALVGEAAARLARRARRAIRPPGRSAAVAPDFPDRNPNAAYLYRQIGSLNINLPEDLSGRSPGGVEPTEMEGYATPTLMITSEHDHLFTPELIREVSTYIPGASVTELPTAGHSPYFETPDVFNATVSEFLAKYI
ncbi:MAG: hypothetical protein QGH07_17030, partial [Alphaproteobacteria bacterium]|nr:hypothetical protein [Alphaproteobacteria bacterium]